MASEPLPYEELKSYLKSLDRSERESFAENCGTTVAYLTKVVSTGERVRESLVINMERESGGKVPCESMRPDVDWAYIRGSTGTPSTVASLKSA